MKILFINSLSADYVQDLMYSGLVKTFGVSSVLDYPWNKKYHIPYKKYPKNLGYTKSSIFQSITTRFSFHYDLVIVASSKVDCFESYAKIQQDIPANVPVIFLDGGDQPVIGGDLTIYGRPELYEQTISKRTFDVIFKREMLKDNTYDGNVFPMPMSFNMDRVPAGAVEKKYDVSFWAVESDQIRIDALDMLQDKFDCASNGTERNQKFSKYKRKGLFYLEELMRCKIVLNFRGGGWDTLRYWEVPAVGGFMISQEPGIVIPNNFVDQESIVFCRDDLTDLVELCEYYLRNEEKRERIAKNAKQHILNFHTDKKRVSYLFDTIKLG